MAIQKRKAVARSAQDALASACGKGTKRAAQEAEAAAPEEELEQPAEQDAEEDGEEISQEDRLAREEESVAALRKKELKAMAAADLKQMVVSKGLEHGNKEENVAALLALEAKARADQRAHEARLRAVVVRKKEELEALPSGELAECCRVAGVLGRMTKQERVQQLMARWQQDDGIAKGLAAMAQEERHAELAAAELPALLGLCAAAGVDPLLREVMVDRLVKHEVAAGRFARPEIHQDEETGISDKGGNKADLVDAVLANESSRKKQLELKRKQEEAEAKRRNDLQSKPVDELKKLLAGKGHEATGKKNELVERLMLVSAQEESLAARRAKLRALGVDELRRMLTERRVEVQDKGKDAMIGAIFEHEKKAREELEAYSALAAGVEAERREELQTRSAAELKEMCAAKGLRLGVAKDDRVAALVEAASADGEIEKLVAAKMRSTRTDELLAMDKAALKSLCDQAGVDAVVKDIVVERILSHESEQGRIETGAGEPDGKPPAKKARSSKKQ